MFSGLRLNNSFYILEKGDDYNLKIGQVTNVNLLYNSIDISVKVNDEILEFKNLQPLASIADSGNVIVSDDKNMMLHEVESTLQSSQDILDKVDYHKKVIDNCNQIINILNPSLAKEKERDEDINKLKNQIQDLETKMDLILNILSKDDGIH